MGNAPDIKVEISLTLQPRQIGRDDIAQQHDTQCG
jgi:hypothetical protein